MIQRVVIVLQILTGLCIVPFAIYYCSSWNDTLFNFFDSMIYHSWVTLAEFCTAYILYLASITSVSFSLFKIKKWISAELAEPFGRRWRCLKDGAGSNSASVQASPGVDRQCLRR